MSNTDPILLLVSRNVLARLGTRTEAGRKITVTELREVRGAIYAEPVYEATLTETDDGCRLVRPTDATPSPAVPAGLDEAWKAAEAALPEGAWLAVTGPYPTLVGHFIAEVRRVTDEPPFAAKTVGDGGRGPTPAAALAALTRALTEPEEKS